MRDGHSFLYFKNVVLHTSQFFQAYLQLLLFPFCIQRFRKRQKDKMRRSVRKKVGLRSIDDCTCRFVGRRLWTYDWGVERGPFFFFLYLKRQVKKVIPRGPCPYRGKSARLRSPMESPEVKSGAVRIIQRGRPISHGRRRHVCRRNSRAQRAI